MAIEGWSRPQGEVDRGSAAAVAPAAALAVIKDLVTNFGFFLDVFPALEGSGFAGKLSFLTFFLEF